MAEFPFQVEVSTSVHVTIEADTEQQARELIDYLDDATLTGEVTPPPIVVRTEVIDSDRSITLITLTEQETA